ncbi:response regulator [Eubacteriales bacterium OttesenSCG-928-N13]|nr:response regulator [Eubacteriales bacterium OttesenSCG-928-N13]
MYKVFLVDDEIVIREGIRNNMHWDEEGFVLCGEAPDSEIALSMIQELKPDILITDIRMPFMDGLELCRRVTRTMPWIHIIILSGHDDFAYAKEAISLGVKEYLLKPVSVSELTEVLQRIAGNISQERAQQADINALKRQLESSSRLMRESCLNNLLDGVNQEQTLAEARKLRMNLLANHYCVMLMALNDPAQLLYARGTVERFADGYGGSVYLCQRAGMICVLVMGDTVDDLEERAYAFAQAVKHEVERTGVMIRIAIGAAMQALGEIGQSLANAGKVLGAMNGRNLIMGASDINTDPPPKLMQLDITPLYEQLQYCSVNDVQKTLHEYLSSLGPTALMSQLMIHYVIVDMMLVASRIIKQSGGEPEEVLQDGLNTQRLMERVHSADDILNVGTELLGAALRYRDEQSATRYSATVRKACQYIENNHQKPEMMLRDVAEHVALSNNHFCTVFGQEMGVTFIEYLTRLRMEKAKNYLKTTDTSSGEIAELVGYNDPHYFRYLFKKHVGMNPRDYRASCRQ